MFNKLKGKDGYDDTTYTVSDVNESNIYSNDDLIVNKDNINKYVDRIMDLPMFTKYDNETSVKSNRLFIKSILEYLYLDNPKEIITFFKNKDENENVINMFFTRMGIDKKDIANMDHNVKLRLMAHMINTLRKKGSKIVDVDFVFIMESLFINLEIYNIVVNKDEVGDLEYQFVPFGAKYKTVNRQLPGRTKPFFTGKHWPALKHYEGMDIYPYYTNMVYYDFGKLHKTKIYKYDKIRYVDEPDTVTNVLLTKISGTTYKVPFDTSDILIVEVDDAVQPESNYVIDRLNGTITFQTDPKEQPRIIGISKKSDHYYEKPMRYTQIKPDDVRTFSIPDIKPTDVINVYTGNILMLRSEYTIDYAAKKLIFTEDPKRFPKVVKRYSKPAIFHTIGKITGNNKVEFKQPEVASNLIFVINGKIQTPKVDIPWFDIAANPNAEPKPITVTFHDDIKFAKDSTVVVIGIPHDSTQIAERITIDTPTTTFKIPSTLNPERITFIEANEKIQAPDKFSIVGDVLTLVSPASQIHIIGEKEENSVRKNNQLSKKVWYKWNADQLEFVRSNSYMNLLGWTLLEDNVLEMPTPINGKPVFAWIIFAEDGYGHDITLDSRGKRFVGVTYNRRNRRISMVEPESLPDDVNFTKFFIEHDKFVPVGSKIDILWNQSHYDVDSLDIPYFFRYLALKYSKHTPDKKTTPITNYTYIRKLSDLNIIEFDKLYEELTSGEPILDYKASFRRLMKMYTEKLQTEFTAPEGPNGEFMSVVELERYLESKYPKLIDTIRDDKMNGIYYVLQMFHFLMAEKFVSPEWMHLQRFYLYNMMYDIITADKIFKYIIEPIQLYFTKYLYPIYHETVNHIDDALDIKDLFNAVQVLDQTKLKIDSKTFDWDLQHIEDKRKLTWTLTDKEQFHYNILDWVYMKSDTMCFNYNPDYDPKYPVDIDTGIYKPDDIIIVEGEDRIHPLSVIEEKHLNKGKFGGHQIILNKKWKSNVRIIGGQPGEGSRPFNAVGKLHRDGRHVTFPPSVDLSRNGGYVLLYDIDGKLQPNTIVETVNVASNTITLKFRLRWTPDTQVLAVGFTNDDYCVYETGVIDPLDKHEVVFPPSLNLKRVLFYEIDDKIQERNPYTNIDYTTNRVTFKREVNNHAVVICSREFSKFSGAESIKCFDYNVKLNSVRTEGEWKTDKDFKGRIVGFVGNDIKTKDWYAEKLPKTGLFPEPIKTGSYFRSVGSDSDGYTFSYRGLTKESLQIYNKIFFDKRVALHDIGRYITVIYINGVIKHPQEEIINIDIDDNAIYMQNAVPADDIIITGVVAKENCIHEYGIPDSFNRDVVRFPKNVDLSKVLYYDLDGEVVAATDIADINTYTNIVKFNRTVGGTASVVALRGDRPKFPNIGEICWNEIPTPDAKDDKKFHIKNNGINLMLVEIDDSLQPLNTVKYYDQDTIIVNQKPQERIRILGAYEDGWNYADVCVVGADKKTITVPDYIDISHHARNVMFLMIDDKIQNPFRIMKSVDETTNTIILTEELPSTNSRVLICGANNRSKCIHEDGILLPNKKQAKFPTSINITKRFFFEVDDKIQGEENIELIDVKNNIVTFKEEIKERVSIVAEKFLPVPSRYCYNQPMDPKRLTFPVTIYADPLFYTVNGVIQESITLPKSPDKTKQYRAIGMYKKNFISAYKFASDKVSVRTDKQVYLSGNHILLISIDNVMYKPTDIIKFKDVATGIIEINPAILKTPITSNSKMIVIGTREPLNCSYDHGAIMPNNRQAQFPKYVDLDKVGFYIVDGQIVDNKDIFKVNPLTNIITFNQPILHSIDVVAYKKAIPLIECYSEVASKDGAKNYRSKNDALDMLFHVVNGKIRPNTFMDNIGSGGFTYKTDEPNPITIHGAFQSAGLFSERGIIDATGSVLTVSDKVDLSDNGSNIIFLVVDGKIVDPKKNILSTSGHTISFNVPYKDTSIVDVYGVNNRANQEFSCRLVEGANIAPNKLAFPSDTDVSRTLFFTDQDSNVIYPIGVDMDSNSALFDFNQSYPIVAAGITSKPASGKFVDTASVTSTSAQSMIIKWTKDGIKYDPSTMLTVGWTKKTDNKLTGGYAVMLVKKEKKEKRDNLCFVETPRKDMLDPKVYHTEYNTDDLLFLEMDDAIQPTDKSTIRSQHSLKLKTTPPKNMRMFGIHTGGSNFSRTLDIDTSGQFATVPIDISLENNASQIYFFSINGKINSLDDFVDHLDVGQNRIYFRTPFNVTTKLIAIGSTGTKLCTMVKGKFNQGSKIVEFPKTVNLRKYLFFEVDDKIQDNHNIKFVDYETNRVTFDQPIVEQVYLLALNADIDYDRKMSCFSTNTDQDRTNLKTHYLPSIANGNDMLLAVDSDTNEIFTRDDMEYFSVTRVDVPKEVTNLKVVGGYMGGNNYSFKTIITNGTTISLPEYIKLDHKGKSILFFIIGGVYYSKKEILYKVDQSHHRIKTRKVFPDDSKVIIVGTNDNRYNCGLLSGKVQTDKSIVKYPGNVDINNIMFSVLDNKIASKTNIVSRDLIQNEIKYDRNIISSAHVFGINHDRPDDNKFPLDNAYDILFMEDNDKIISMSHITYSDLTGMATDIILPTTTEYVFADEFGKNFSYEADFIVGKEVTFPIEVEFYNNLRYIFMIEIDGVFHHPKDVIDVYATDTHKSDKDYKAGTYNRDETYNILTFKNDMTGKKVSAVGIAGNDEYEYVDVIFNPAKPNEFKLPVEYDMKRVIFYDIDGDIKPQASHSKFEIDYKTNEVISPFKITTYARVFVPRRDTNWVNTEKGKSEILFMVNDDIVRPITDIIAVYPHSLKIRHPYIFDNKIINIQTNGTRMSTYGKVTADPKVMDFSGKRDDVKPDLWNNAKSIIAFSVDNILKRPDEVMDSVVDDDKNLVKFKTNMTGKQVVAIGSNNDYRYELVRGVKNTTSTKYISVFNDTNLNDILFHILDDKVMPQTFKPIIDHNQIIYPIPFTTSAVVTKRNFMTIDVKRQQDVWIPIIGFDTHKKHGIHAIDMTEYKNDADDKRKIILDDPYSTEHYAIEERVSSGTKYNYLGVVQEDNRTVVFPKTVNLNYVLFFIIDDKIYNNDDVIFDIDPNKNTINFHNPIKDNLLKPDSRVIAAGVTDNNDYVHHYGKIGKDGKTVKFPSDMNLSRVVFYDVDNIIQNQNYTVASIDLDTNVIVFNNPVTTVSILSKKKGKSNKCATVGRFNKVLFFTQDKRIISTDEWDYNTVEKSVIFKKDYLNEYGVFYSSMDGKRFVERGKNGKLLTEKVFNDKVNLMENGKYIMFYVVDGKVISPLSPPLPLFDNNTKTITFNTDVSGKDVIIIGVDGNSSYSYHHGNVSPNKRDVVFNATVNLDYIDMFIYDSAPVGLGTDDIKIDKATNTITFNFDVVNTMDIIAKTK